MKFLLRVLLRSLCVLIPATVAVAQADDPFPSWNEGPAKRSIVQDEAIAKGWTVIDMKRDWIRIFSFED